MSYAEQVPALILSGVGMSLYFIPTASLLMASVRTEQQGVASGANNAMRELGGVLGVAVLASVFSSQGGFVSPQDFVDGLVPALWVGVALAAVGSLTAALIRAAARTGSTRSRAGPAPTGTPRRCPSPPDRADGNPGCRASAPPGLRRDARWA